MTKWRRLGDVSCNVRGLNYPRQANKLSHPAASMTGGGGVGLFYRREVWETFGDFVVRASPKLGPGIKERMAFAASVTADQANAARKVAAACREHLRALVPPGTVVALPTSPSIAPRVELNADELESFRVRVMRLTCPAGLAGLPQINLPVGTVYGCPAGLSFIAWSGGDEVLLDLAVSLARYCGQSL